MIDARPAAKIEFIMNKDTKKGPKSLKDDKTAAPVPHEFILTELFKKVEKVDFIKEGKLKPNTKLSEKQYRILVVAQIVDIAKRNNWNLGHHNGFNYVFNGEYWGQIELAELKRFLGHVAYAMGVPWEVSADFVFMNNLYKQFEISTLISNPRKSSKGSVLINLKNGTFQISPTKTLLRRFNSGDCLKYQLPFNYDSKAKAPIFQKFLERVLPDKSCQNVLAEFIASAFVHIANLKRL